MKNYLTIAALVLLAGAAIAQDAEPEYSDISCESFRALLLEAQSGSTSPELVAAVAYRVALIDAFTWYYGRTSIEREFNRVVERCDSTLAEAAQELSENIFYDFEDELRNQIEYSSE